MSIAVADILFEAMRKAVAAEIGNAGPKAAGLGQAKRPDAVMTSYQSAGLGRASGLSLCYSRGRIR